MHKKEIEKKLLNHWIKKGDGWRQYEVAKALICRRGEQLSHGEYEARIKIISEYLGI